MTKVGVYQECAPSDAGSCQFQLAMAGQAGFGVVLNYSAWEGTQGQVLAFAAMAQAQGLQVIWPFNAQSHLDNPSGVAPFVSLVDGLPATWGYYVGDETPVSEQPKVAQISNTIRGMSSKHLLFMADSPTGNAPELTAFYGDAGYLGGDTYPVGTAAAVSYVTKVAQAVHGAAQGKHTAMALQAFSWAQYEGGSAPFPTQAQMRTMRDLAIAGCPGLDLILWYSQYDILRSSDPQGNWNALVGAAF